MDHQTLTQAVNGRLEEEQPTAAAKTAKCVCRHVREQECADVGTHVPTCLSVGLMQRSGMRVHESVHADIYKHLWTTRWDPHSGSQFLSVLS